MKIRTKESNFALKKELNKNTDKSPYFGWKSAWNFGWKSGRIGFGERIYDVNIEKYPILSC